MKLNDLLNQKSEGLKGTGPNSDIVISSRIRLARNLEKLSFSHWADEKEQGEVLTKVESAINESNYLKGSLFLKMREMSNIDKQFLVERHLISREHATGSDHKGVMISDKEIVSIMINEEDHLRLQVIQSGFNLAEARLLTDRIESELESHLNFAFSSNWGYLTACPTNVGTGMRASVMLHLPALVMTNQISKVLQAIAKLSLTTRGLFGEGTEAKGNFFQISNQISLGRLEIEIIDNIERVIKQVMEYEQSARNNLLTHNKDLIEDRVWRAYGILKGVRIISSNETIDLLSSVRLGVDIGLLKDIDRGMVNELFILTQPAHLQKIEGKALTADKRDVKRAELIRKKLNM
jgi:protein arginine kinase